MKRLRSFTSVFVASALLIPISATPSHAVENPSLQLRVSNQLATPGQAMVISGVLENCSTLPTTLNLNLTRNIDEDAFVQISITSSSFKYYKVGTTFFMNWIYRGPTGDGIEAGPIFAYANASGGCITSPFGIGGYTSWMAVSNQSSVIPEDVSGFYSSPLLTGLRLSWGAPQNVLSRDLFYQVQYTVLNTDNWSHSITTRDTSLVLANLLPWTMYRVRVRAVNSAGAGPWTLSPPDYGSDQFATAGYSVVSANSSNTITSTIASGDTVTIKMHLTHCTYAPYPFNDPDPSRSGTIDYRIFPIVNGYADGYHAISGLIDNPISGPSGVYDSNAQTYDVSFPLSGLADGTYELETYFFGQGCSYDYTPELTRYPNGETIRFTIGAESASIPQWSGPIGITKLTTTSATLAWNPPANLGDGPFTYSVDIIDSINEKTRLIGSTTDTSMLVTGLVAGSQVAARVTVTNSVTPSGSAPYSMVALQMPDVVVKGGTKLALPTLLKTLGLTVPTGGTSAVAMSTKKTALKDCAVAKNVISLKSVIGACSVAITITPKRIGNRKPKPVVQYYDILTKR